MIGVEVYLVLIAAETVVLCYPHYYDYNKRAQLMRKILESFNSNEILTIEQVRGRLSNFLDKETLDSIIKELYRAMATLVEDGLKEQA